MDEFNIIEGTLIGAAAGTSIVAVPDGVKKIGKYAFEACAGAEEIVLPGSVEAIEACAFAGCKRLKNVAMPDTIAYIGERAFEDCKSLVEIMLPKNIKTIKRSTFYGCASLRSAALPSALVSIEGWAFADCAALDGIAFPESLLSINKGAFENCRSLRSVNLPKGVSSAGRDAFSGCDALETIGTHIEGVRRSINLAAEKSGFAFFDEESDKYAYTRYVADNEYVLKRYTGYESKTFTTEANNAARNYGGYLASENKIAELFNWLDIRDSLGGSMKRATLPPSFVLSAIGYKDEDIVKYFRYRKPCFLKLCRNPRFIVLNAEVKSNIVKLYAKLGGFTNVYSDSEAALNITCDILKNLGESEIHRYFDGLPSGCATVAKKALPFFSEAVKDISFLETAARYLTEYSSICDDYAAISDNMVKRIRNEQDADTRALMKAKLKDFKIDIDFVNRYAAKHRLFVKHRELAPAIEKYRKEITQSDADFLDMLYGQAENIYLAVQKGARSAVKDMETGVTDQNAGEFRYEWADILDPALMVLGYATACCFKPPDNTGAAVLGEAVVSPDVWPLIVYCGADIAAFAIVLYNADENGLLVDNIEVAPQYQRKGLDREILLAVTRGVADMRNAMNAKGRRILAANIKYDPFNDLNGAIEKDLPLSSVELRCKTYIFENYTYSSGGDKPQREIISGGAR